MVLAVSAAQIIFAIIVLIVIIAALMGKARWGGGPGPGL